MKKHFLLAGFAALMLFACNNKPVSELTLSGLDPAKFQTEVNNTQTNLYTLKNKAGMEVCITNFGGRIVSIMVPDKNGKMQDVVLGFDSIADYINVPSDFGASIGRYANRINQGRFVLDGDTIQLPQNNFGHCLHGGPKGWQYQVYEANLIDPMTLELTRISPDGDENFPGNVTAKVTYTLTEDNAIDIKYSATTDKKTIINMTNHSYFNLAGSPSKASTDNILYVNADYYTPVDGPFERNPHYVRLSNPGHAHKHTGLDNEGFFGIGVRKGEEYRFSVWARLPQGNGKETLRIELVDTKSMGEHQAFATADLTVDSKEWKKYQLILKPGMTQPKSTLRIFLTSKGTVDLEHISLFPVETWKGHENGLRKDLAQALADIHPGVFRFPGGCIVEGTDLNTRYDWKKSVGPVENRPLNENRWQYTFTHRFYPDYYQSYGLGFYEYFLLSEEMGAEPLPILNCGLSCQYQNNDPKAHVAVCDLDGYIQDALDLIEFANGDVNSTWGKVRADMGHPAPFNLKFIGIGNEQWGKEYPERLEPFIKAIRKAYPDMKIVGSSGPNSEGKEFDYLWPEMKRLKADLVDEHFYRPESWFLAQGARYDNYDRKGPKVFAQLKSFAFKGTGCSVHVFKSGEEKTHHSLIK